MQSLPRHVPLATPGSSLLLPRMRVYRYKCAHLNNHTAHVQTSPHAGGLLTGGDRGSAPAHLWDAGSALSELLLFKEARTPGY